MADIFPESRNPTVLFTEKDGLNTIEIPHGADTSYLAHGYFRFIGKYPPQIVSWILNKYKIKGLIVDPMCGGGTTLIEARLRGCDALGFDINPISIAVSTLVSTPFPVDELDETIALFLKKLSPRLSHSEDLFSIPPSRKMTVNKLKYCKEYFSNTTALDIGEYQDLSLEMNAKYRNLFSVALFSILRNISRANIKKMNLEIDDNKKRIPILFDAISAKLQEISMINKEYVTWAHECNIDIMESDASTTRLADNTAQAVFLHPPYLTNTAFSEFTQLQLAILGVDHKSIWKKELRCRGSFMHEPNGLKKYLIDWANIIKEANRILVPGGKLITVVGDGQIDYIRIPVGAITHEFASDCGMEHIESFFHILNNHTGQTQSRKMKGQHVSIFQKANR